MRETTSSSKLREALERIAGIPMPPPVDQAQKVAVDMRNIAIYALKSAATETEQEQKQLRKAVGILRTAIIKIRNDILDMIRNEESENFDSYTPGLLLSICGDCVVALHNTKEFANAD